MMSIHRVGYGHPDAMRLIHEVQAEYVVRYGGPDETPLDPLMFEPPAGSFYVGYVGGEPVATGAWRRTGVEAFGTTQTAEIKRMYVAPGGRGRGLARQMLAHLEQSAREHGAEALVLETGERQPEAIALYESSGYEPVPAFGYYKDAPLSRCYGRRLATTT
jgi:GNAT superfamily N-acetyltransferase